MTGAKKICCDCFNRRDEAKGRKIGDRWYCNTCIGKYGSNEESTGARELPKVKIGTETYYRDDRLKQLRNINNPHDFMDYY